jgi:hypothetical protein
MRGTVPPLHQYAFMAWYLVKNHTGKIEKSVIEKAVSVTSKGVPLF